MMCTNWITNSYINLDYNLQKLTSDNIRIIKTCKARDSEPKNPLKVSTDGRTLMEQLI